MHRYILILLMLVATHGFAQKKITWQTLADVQFTDKYSEEEEAYYFYPHFGQSVKELKGREVYITGYMLVLGVDEDIFILSKSSYSDCFFCGKSGPESIIELQLKKGHQKFKMDELVTIKGRLKLNRDDIYHCNYILEDAVVYNAPD